MLEIRKKMAHVVKKKMPMKTWVNKIPRTLEKAIRKFLLMMTMTPSSENCKMRIKCLNGNYSHCNTKERKMKEVWGAVQMVEYFLQPDQQQRFKQKNLSNSKMMICLWLHQSRVFLSSQPQIDFHFPPTLSIRKVCIIFWQLDGYNRFGSQSTSHRQLPSEKKDRMMNRDEETMN